MARKIVIKRPDSTTYRGWTFVIIVGLVVATLALIHRGGLESFQLSDGSTGCQLVVTADELNVRAQPDAASTLVQTLNNGAHVDGTRVVQNGFRQLEGSNRWAADQYMAPLAGSNCT